MIKTILFTVLIALCNLTNCLSQDTITKKSGEVIKAKIYELNPTQIKYKNFDNQDGPLIIVPKSEVLLVTFEKGTKQTFGDGSKPTEPFTLNSPTENMFTKGQLDASKYYDGYSGAGTGTLITSLLSPLVGLIPAIACASTQPKDKNLNYPEAELMKNADYNKGYTEKARKTKKNKVWNNWVIGLGVNLVAVLVISASSSHQK